MPIDLHTHTTESDGTFPPAALVAAARNLGLEALGITDHDTFAGYDLAREPARAAGLDLVCGIEVSTKYRFANQAKSGSVHVLAYFLDGGPPPSFREWIRTMQQARRDRNARLAVRLQALGLDVSLADAEALGRHLTGRPHFAQALVEKGYVASTQEAFDTYLGENGAAYVERDEPALADAVSAIAVVGGIASLAHPIRPEQESGPDFVPFVAELKEAGLRAIEAWHSDHEPADIERFRALAARMDLAVTGGTDFHGETKPGVALGVGRGSLSVPREVLDRLRKRFFRGASS